MYAHVKKRFNVHTMSGTYVMDLLFVILILKKTNRTKPRTRYRCFHIGLLSKPAKALREYYWKRDSQ